MRTTLLVLCVLLIYGLSDGYKLNVPRVLLPYHPNIQVNFPLEVTSGCFFWRSTRPDIVTVETVNPDANGCSNKAIITAKAKHAEEQIAVIFADNKDAGISLSCGVTIDVIKSIAITTTAKTLFVDAAPARMIVEAFNKEGDRFSSLGDIPFDWYFDTEESVRPLKIIPFSQSKYDAPIEIQKLENEKQRGYVVLVEGISTGSAMLTAKFSENHLSRIEASTIDLMVIANILLKPPHDIYVPIYSIIQYGAVLVKENVVEDIIFPSNQYQIIVSDLEICSFDEKTTKVTALTLGDTEILLVDNNMKAKGLRPQSAHMYVVDPESIQFSIDKGGYWYLQKGQEYHISVKLLDVNGNDMYIPENAEFDTIIPTDLFEVIESSKNNVHFHVKAIANGNARLYSKLSRIYEADGTYHDVYGDKTIAGEQEVYVNDKIESKPYLLVFPYQPNTPYRYQILATGGTGNYKWSSESLQIATIDETKGVLKTGEIGHTVIKVQDVYNPNHFALSQVYVLEPADVKWGESHLEAELHSNLILNVRALGLDSKTRKLMPFTDCRLMDFHYAIADQKVFRINANQQSEIPIEGRGCATVSLKALTSADTKIKVNLDRFSDEQTISAFPPLIINVNNELLLIPGSEIKFTYEGGPRPWILDSRKYFFEAVSESAEFVSVISNSDQHTLKCGLKTSQTDLMVNVGNKKSTTNSLPVVAIIKLSVCCSIPDRLFLGTKPFESTNNLPSCPSFAHSIYYGSPSKLQLFAFGKCINDGTNIEKQFDSITGLKPTYKVDHENMLSVKHSKEQPNIDKLYSDALPKSIFGLVKVTSYVNILQSQLSTSLSLNLVGIPEAIPSSLVLWNSKEIRGSVGIAGGSGHFWIDPKSVAEIVESELIAHEKEEISQIKLYPLSQGYSRLMVYDLCINGAKVPVDIWVSDVKLIKIVGSDLVQLNSQTPIQIEVYGNDNRMFSSDVINFMGLEVGIQHDAAKIRENSLLNYHVHGSSVGTSVITASIRATSGKLIKAVHQIQVFAPLKLLPDVVTLVPESVFQFEIVGGPQPLPKIEFKLNKTNIATVAENGLISSLKTIGETAVTALITSDGGNRVISQDTAIIRVVSLAGMKVVLSSKKVDVGETFTARIEGFDQRENPFSFGGAEYPFEINWSVDSENIVELSPIYPVKEENLNKFGARFMTMKRGHATITASLTVHPLSTRHFTTRRGEFVSTAEVIVQEKLGLISPVIGLNSVIITPETKFELKPNRNEKEVVYALTEQTEILTLHGQKKNQIYSGSVEGTVSLKMSHSSFAYNETGFITVDVMNPASMELIADLSGVEFESGNVPLLPHGSTVKIMVIMKDHRGRVFSAFNNDLKFRAHRFDLTDIVAVNGNKEFTVFLKHKGETVFSVWDSTNPRLNAFIRLPIGEVIPPIEVDEENIDEKQVCEVPEITVTKPEVVERKWVDNKLFENGFPMLVCFILLLASGYILYYSYQIKNDTGNITLNRSVSFHSNGLKPVTSSTPNNFIPQEPTIASRFPRKEKSDQSFVEDSLNKSSSFSTSNDSSFFSPRNNKIFNRHYGN